MPLAHCLALFLILAASCVSASAASAQDIAVAGIAAPAQAPQSVPEPNLLTLPQAYALALKRSETLAIHQEIIKETEGRFLQALSTALPRASFVSSEKRQDGSGGSSFTLKEIPERKFAFSQPIFAGFKEFAAIAASRAERRQRILEKTRAEQLLLVDVAEAFYLLRQQREDLHALEITRTALAQRIEELRAREQLGRSRPAEVASAEAQLRRVEAERERVNGAQLTTRQLLEFLTGIDQLEGPSDEEAPRSALEAESVYLAKAGSRPDVQAADEAWQVAKNGVAVARGMFFPTVDLESNYYTKRVGVSSGVDWDVLLKVDVPLFQGGRALSEVNQAAARAREAKLHLAQAQREAALDIRQLYTQAQAAYAQSATLEQARAAAEENYRWQVHDYQRNLVSNLEVLKAIQDLQDARRDAISAKYEAKRLSWRLRVAAGEAL